MSFTPSDTSTAAWFDAIQGASLVSGLPGPISAVTRDSREVQKGGLFVAVPGFEVDGHGFLRPAIEAGAAAVVVQSDQRATWEPLLANVPVAVVSAADTRVALAQAAAGFYGHPARKLGIVGVTGTDGKTTSVHIIAHVLEACGKSSGYLSSVAFRGAGNVVLNDTHMTTVESTIVQEKLAEMVTAGRNYAVLEASSHGLDLHRLDECEFDVAVFTSLSRDHLDYHKTMDAYRAAKGRLFEMEAASVEKGIPKCAVVNADDAAADYFLSLSTTAHLTFGLRGADVTAHSIAADGLKTRFEIAAGDQRVAVDVGLVGEFNVYNCLAAAAVGLSQGLLLSDIAEAFATFTGVPGRMQFIDAGQAFNVVVDIASTKEALRRVLTALRSVTQGRLGVVFGCAGERDVARREGMGRVAGELADHVILTNEDPRREDPDAIIDEIATAAVAAGKVEGHNLARVPDRRGALQAAIDWARPADTVLLAGKGTEQSIIIGTEHYPWDEARVARELLGDA